ncbi:hypothetical protein PDE_09631 [Penicillium oxalicum 114-2]|uniref:PQ loop repeat protein n=1 Tax=Penicillium oxalicum (strain 114-2 / CGMCC 5302) TaxID=933388 RepID=S8BHK1_PENO1|nr:hypothetical protein PDE_09631 [Penicillium oxalicum 114-2]
MGERESTERTTRMFPSAHGGSAVGTLITHVRMTGEWVFVGDVKSVVALAIEEGPKAFMTRPLHRRLSVRASYTRQAVGCILGLRVTGISAAGWSKGPVLVAHSATSSMSDGNVTVASNVLGTIGTVLWCIQLIPQIWYNYRRKKTDGFPAAMMLLWASCSVPMGAYFILQKVNIPLQVQPQLFGFFSLVAWSQILHYSHDLSLTKAMTVCAGTVVLFGGLEALLILTLRIPYSKGVTWPDLVVGIFGAILISAGLIPPYFELWKRDGRVIGFNWVFLGIDTLGGLFSLFALAAQGSFDILGGIMYILVVVLEAGIYLSHLIWRFRYRKLRREAKETGRSVDELLESRENGSGRAHPHPLDHVALCPVDDVEKQAATPRQGA